MSNSIYTLDDTLPVTGGQRFLNYLLDNIFILLSIFIIGFITAFFAELFDLTGLKLWQSNIGDLEGRLIFIFITIFYYFFTEGVFGRSPAKLITGTVVVDENGEKPDSGTILKRTLCRIIPFDGFSFLRAGRGWHDSMSNTYVVNKKALEENVKLFHELRLIGVEQTES